MESALYIDFPKYSSFNVLGLLLEIVIMGVGGGMSDASSYFKILSSRFIQSPIFKLSTRMQQIFRKWQ